MKVSPVDIKVLRNCLSFASQQGTNIFYIFYSKFTALFYLSFQDKWPLDILMVQN